MGEARARRRDALAALGREALDVLVVGGGINGAGIARDAAMRGLRVALVERGDLASGTSSRSTTRAPTIRPPSFTKPATSA